MHMLHAQRAQKMAQFFTRLEEKHCDNMTKALTESKGLLNASKSVPSSSRDVVAKINDNQKMLDSSISPHLEKITSTDAIQKQLQIIIAAGVDEETKFRSMTKIQKSQRSHVKIPHFKEECKLMKGFLIL